MDTYGLINLTWLDTEIKWLESLEAIKTISGEGKRRLVVLKEIKELCFKLPSAEKVFNASIESQPFDPDDSKSVAIPKYENFEDYITQFITSNHSPITSK